MAILIFLKNKILQSILEKEKETRKETTLKKKKQCGYLFFIYGPDLVTRLFSNTP